MSRRASASAVLRWVPAVAWAGVIFALSAQPGSKLPSGYSVWGHLGAYAVLGVLIWAALGGRRAGWRGVALAIVLASVYGITDEFHQSFVPARTPDVVDWLTDTVGAAVATVSAFYLSTEYAARRRSADGD